MERRCFFLALDSRFSRKKVEKSGTEKLPPSTFKDLIGAYKFYDKKSDELKTASLAQWLLESGRGTSNLAKEHLNFGGIKWREEMKPYATPVEYVASDGSDTYCHFKSIQHFIEGYWTFINRPPYKGYEANRTAEGFLRHVGPIYATDPAYTQKVIALIPEARGLLGVVDPGDNTAPQPTEFDKPPVRWFPSQKYSSRNGVKVNLVVCHYTVSRTAQSALDTLSKPLAQGGREASAHYLIDKDGTIYQLVSELNKAWHAPNVNRRSVGIEHVAMPGERLEAKQEKASVALISYLLSKYGLRHTNITAHRWTGQATSCPGNLFGPDGSEAEFLAWRKANFGKDFA